MKKNNQKNHFNQVKFNSSFIHSKYSKMAASLAVGMMIFSLTSNHSYAQTSTIQSAESNRDEIQILPEVTVTAPVTNNATPTEETGSYRSHSTAAAVGINLSLRETPQSISTVTRQQIDDQNMSALSEALTQIPGLFTTNYGPKLGASSSLIYARGHSIGDNNLLIDGVSTPSSALASNGNHASIDTAIYDSIVVVRGATGLMSGAGNPGASISLTRKRPTHEFRTQLEGSIGRWGQHRTMVDLGGPLNSSASMRGRIVVAHDKEKSWVSRYNGDQATAFGVLEADINDNTSLILSLERSKLNSKKMGYGHYGYSRIDSSGSPTNFPISTNKAQDWERQQIQRTSISAALNHQINYDWSANLSIRRDNRSQHQRMTDLGTVALPGEELPTYAWAWTWANDLSAKSDILDANVAGLYNLFGRKHEITLGIQYSKVNEHTPFVSYPDAPSAEWIADRVVIPEPNWDQQNNFANDRDVKQAGFYASTRFHVSDNLSLVGGARLSYWSTRTTNLSNNTYFDPYSPVTDSRRERLVPTPYLGVVYDVYENTSIYASYTEIFNPQNRKDVQGRMLNPEEGINYEVGLKTEAKGLLFNFSAFEIRKNNLAVRDGENRAPDGSLAWRAEDNTRGRGWEIEMSGEIYQNWSLQASFSNFRNRDSSGNNLMEYIPKQQLKVFTTFQPKNIPNLTLGTGMSWQSKVYEESCPNNLRNYCTQQSYALFDMMATYSFGKHTEIGLNLNNVFDKRYLTRADRHNYGAPRNFTVKIQHVF